MSFNNQPPSSLSLRLVWFQLVDSERGEPYRGTSATTVYIPNDFVMDQFRDAVKAEFADNHLKGIAPSDLQVFKNRASFDKRHFEEGREEPLEVDSLVGDLGKSKKDALIVVAQASNLSNLSNTFNTEKLKAVGIEFTIEDIEYLLKKDAQNFALLMSSELTSTETQSIQTCAKSKIKSETKREIGLKHSYFLHNALNIGQGQIKASWYYAFSKSSGVVVAKVYNGHQERFEREVAINNVLDHRNLVKFIKTFSIQDEECHIIIMPFFPKSVAETLTLNFQYSLERIQLIAQDCFDALCHLHGKGFCFADLKPSNMRLTNSEPNHIVLVDYGATVPMRSPLIEFTQQYCLDADKHVATEYLDWICLGTSLVQIAGLKIDHLYRAEDVAYAVNNSGLHDALKKVILSCLLSPSSFKIASALKDME